MLLVLAVSVIFIIDGIPLIKKKQWGVLAVFLAILAAACTLYITRKAGLPAPINMLNDLFMNSGKQLFG